ncbi:Asp23/Gls24 family envelope stress response protein [Nocardia sp. NBC_00416]|uniref:Asp23/Gls24 family envelope stress response protein n=1 Tax=Nocardia sp. NBC_00416 TaxID=2975991 RepID=UPI002E22A698
MSAARTSIVVGDPVIAAVAARAAAATPGVVRLEPGVRGLVGTAVRLGRQRLTGNQPAPAEGVRVRRTTAGLQVSVDIAIGAHRRAADIGPAVQQEIVRAVREQTGERVDEVCVCVLDIEPEQR